MHPLLLTPGQAAEALALSAAEVEGLITRGELPVTDLGDGVRRIARAALEQFVLRHTPGLGAGSPAAPLHEPSVVLTQEDPMTPETTSPPYPLPRGMHWRVSADGTYTIRLRVQVAGTTTCKTFPADELGAACAFQEAVKAGRDPALAAKDVPARPAACPVPDEARPPAAPRLRPPAGLGAESTLEAAFAAFLQGARAGAALTREDAPYALSTLIGYEEATTRQVRRYGELLICDWVPHRLTAILADTTTMQGGESAKKVRSALVSLARYLGSWGLIVNAASLAQVRVPKARRASATHLPRPARALSGAQRDALAACAIARDEQAHQHLLAPAIALCAFGGLAPGELRALRVGDFDPEAGTIAVERAMKRVSATGASRPGDTKAEDRERTRRRERGAGASDGTTQHAA